MVLNILHSSKKDSGYAQSKGKDLHPVFLTMKEVLVVLKISPLLLPGGPQGYEQCASEVQDLNEDWNTQLIKKGNAVRQTTKLSI